MLVERWSVRPLQALESYQLVLHGIWNVQYTPSKPSFAAHGIAHEKDLALEREKAVFSALDEFRV